MIRYTAHRQYDDELQRTDFGEEQLKASYTGGE
jgi:hypothetical protein